MIKYIDKLNPQLGSVFFSDNEKVFSDMQSAIDDCKKSFIIFNPSAKISSYNGTIRESFDTLRIYSNMRIINLSRNKSKVVDERGSVIINNEGMQFYYDYSLLFDGIPNLIGREFSYRGKTVKADLHIQDFDYIGKKFTSFEEYLDSMYITRTDISASYNFYNEEYDEWEDIHAFLLYRRVKEYEKKQGG